MQGVDPRIAAYYGYSLNRNGGLYRNGVSYDVLTKLRIAQGYLEILNEHGCPPSYAQLARDFKVSVNTAKKVVSELLSEEGVQDPHNTAQRRPRGPGARTMDELDAATLIQLLREEPSRTLPNYQLNLLERTGTLVSTSVISRFFNHGCPFKASFRQPNHIPYDKFKEENLTRAIDYANFIATVEDKSRLKFVDEKHLKGEELYNRQTRRDPLTGELYPILVNSDFRNAYNILGICGIDVEAPAMHCWITDETNDAEGFSQFIEGAVARGVLRRFDILVLDNAAIHTGRDNEFLESWLWDYDLPDGLPLYVQLITLPTRSPELNPIELLWAILVRRLKLLRLAERSNSRHAAAHAAAAILEEFDHVLVGRCFVHCNYLEDN
jgi:hypothetical protein